MESFNREEAETREDNSDTIRTSADSSKSKIEYDTSRRIKMPKNISSQSKNRISMPKYEDSHPSKSAIQTPSTSINYEQMYPETAEAYNDAKNEADRAIEEATSETLDTINRYQAVLDAHDNSHERSNLYDHGSVLARNLKDRLVKDKFEEQYEKGMYVIKGYLFRLERLNQNKEPFKTAVATASDSNQDFVPRDLLIPYYIEKKKFGIISQSENEELDAAFSKCGRDRDRFITLLETSLNAVLDIERDKGISDSKPDSRFATSFDMIGNNKIHSR